MADSQTIRDTNRPPRWRRFLKEFFWPFKNADPELIALIAVIVAWMAGFITVIMFASNLTRNWSNQGLAFITALAITFSYIGVTALAIRAWVESE